MKGFALGLALVQEAKDNSEITYLRFRLIVQDLEVFLVESNSPLVVKQLKPDTYARFYKFTKHAPLNQVTQISIHMWCLLFVLCDWQPC